MRIDKYCFIVSIRACGEIYHILVYTPPIYCIFAFIANCFLRSVGISLMY